MLDPRDHTWLDAIRQRPFLGDAEPFTLRAYRTAWRTAGAVSGPATRRFAYQVRRGEETWTRVEQFPRIVAN